MPFNLVFTSQSTFVEVVSGVFKEEVKIFGISYLYISNLELMISLELMEASF